MSLLAAGTPQASHWKPTQPLAQAGEATSNGRDLRLDTCSPTHIPCRMRDDVIKMQERRQIHASSGRVFHDHGVNQVLPHKAGLQFADHCAAGAHATAQDSSDFLHDVVHAEGKHISAQLARCCKRNNFLVALSQQSNTPAVTASEQAGTIFCGAILRSEPISLRQTLHAVCVMARDFKGCL